MTRCKLVWEVTVQNAAEAKDKLFGVNHPIKSEENQESTVSHGKQLESAMKKIQNK